MINLTETELTGLKAIVKMRIFELWPVRHNFPFFISELHELINILRKLRNRNTTKLKKLK